MLPWIDRAANSPVSILLGRFQRLPRRSPHTWQGGIVRLARLGLAQTLGQLSGADEASADFHEPLRLNPNDNQGVRYLLLSELVRVRRDDEALTLLARLAQGYCRRRESNPHGLLVHGILRGSSGATCGNWGPPSVRLTGHSRPPATRRNPDPLPIVSGLSAGSGNGSRAQCLL